MDYQKKIGKENLIVDKSAGKMPHKISKKVEFSDEKTGRVTTFSEDSEIINALSKK